MNLRFRHLFFCAMLLAGMNCHAQNQETEKKPETPKPPEESGVFKTFLKRSLRFAEDARDLVSDRIVTISRGIDSFIGDERAVEEINGSHVRLRQNTIFYKDGGVDLTITSLFKLDLPRTDERLSLVVESDSEEEAPGTAESEGATAPQIQPTQDAELQDSAFNSALQYILQSNEEWHVRAHAGIQFNEFDLDPNTKLRIRRTFVSPPWEFRIAQTFFWYNSLGWGETTQFDLDRPVVSGFFFRTTNKSTWLNDTDILDMSQRFTIYQDLGNRQLLSYQAAAFANSDPTRRITAYTISLAFRTLLYEDWLFLDIAPVAVFPEDNNFDFTPTFTVSFEAVLGNLN